MKYVSTVDTKPVDSTERKRAAGIFPPFTMENVDISFSPGWRPLYTHWIVGGYACFNTPSDVDWAVVLQIETPVNYERVSICSAIIPAGKRMAEFTDPGLAGVITPEHYVHMTVIRDTNIQMNTAPTGLVVQMTTER